MTRTRRRDSLRYLMGAALFAWASAAAGEEFAIYGQTARLYPSAPGVAQDIYLVVERFPCFNGGPTALAFDASSKTFSLGFASGPELDPCPPIFRAPLRIRLPKVSAAGDYTLNIYSDNRLPAGQFDPQNLLMSREIVIASTPIYWFETPAQGSILSGVGLIRGWVCDAESVQIQFDDMPLLNAGYGATRADTFDICGDDDNGYGLAYAWGLLGEGEHRMKTYIDDEVVADVGFSVTSLGEPFVTGLSRVVELQDFPADGESVLLQWSEAAQNFIIVEYASQSPD